MGLVRRNKIVGTVHGPNIQVQQVSGDVNIHSPTDHERLITLYEELNLVRRQLTESVQAERDITQVAWMLAMMLSRLCSSQEVVEEGVAPAKSCVSNHSRPGKIGHPAGF